MSAIEAAHGEVEDELADLYVQFEAGHSFQVCHARVITASTLSSIPLVMHAAATHSSAIPLACIVARAAVQRIGLQHIPATLPVRSEWLCRLLSSSKHNMMTTGFTNHTSFWMRLIFHQIMATVKRLA